MACKFGSHRVLEPKGSLPQAAWRLDAEAPLQDNEILVEVDTLNIDSASFTQLEEECEHDLTRIGGKITEIITQRGKMQNPVTGSGGMLMGTIRQVGEAVQGQPNSQGHVPHEGLRIATLVSLSLTPLRLRRLGGINPESDQVKMDGEAILFESGLWTPLPDDLPEEVSLAILDVAGAPAQTARLVKPGDRVLVLGAGGKSGTLCCYEASRRVGPLGEVIGLERNPAAREDLLRLGLCKRVLDVDASQPLEVAGAVGGEVDLVINCVNIRGTEMSSVLPVRQGGMVYFFSMATSFTAAALGAEGMGKDVDMMIGNGFTRGHDLFALQILRDSPDLLELFKRRYVPALLATPAAGAGAGQAHPGPGLA